MDEQTTVPAIPGDDDEPAALMAVDGGGGGAADAVGRKSDVELIQEHCVELFSMLDFVMEPQVIATLLAFFQAGGQPERVIELLSGNYQGLGQHANLLGCWLADLELEGRGGPATADQQQPGDRPVGDFPSSSTSSSSATPVPLLMGVDVRAKIESCPAVRDCFEHCVSQMIRKQFAPEAADKIFETDDGSNEGIDWLPELISHRPWRRLIYELAEHFPNCLMLNFAVKLISDAGFQHEISNVNTAAQQLDIFSRVFLSSVEQLLEHWARAFGERRTEACQRAFAELRRVACHSEQTFLYTQMLLGHVGWQGSGPTALVCSSLGQQLRLACEEADREHLGALHIGMLQACVDRVPAHISQAMSAMLAKGLNPADIAQLYQAYSGPDPPPAQLVQDPLFTEMLVEALFSAGAARVHKEHRPKYIFLLSYASSVAETSRGGGGPGTGGGGRRQNKARLQSTREQMQRLVDILHSREDLMLSLDALLELSHLPVLAAALLHFLRTLLLREDLLTEASPLHFVLLDRVAQQHPNLHARLFRLLSDLYDLQSRRNEVAEIVMERQRQIVDRFVQLLLSGTPVPVLEKLSAMFRDGHIDVSLVRYFCVEVLDQVGPPYTAQFVAAFLPIVTNREVFDRATLEKHPTAREFLLNCRADEQST